MAVAKTGCEERCFAKRFRVAPRPDSEAAFLVVGTCPLQPRGFMNGSARPISCRIRVEKDNHLRCLTKAGSGSTACRMVPFFW
jgi:hypothetical protein